MALLVTMLLSLFFIIGIFIPKFFKAKEQLGQASIAIALVVMFYLIIFDLGPEILEIFPLDVKNILIILIFVVLGIVFLKILDLFIPEHTHNHKEVNDDNEEHNGHLFHIGFITSIALIVHNMLEGMSIYAISLNDIKTGLIMAISVGLHNLPLGTEISISTSLEERKKGRKNIIIFLLIISNFIGALLLSLFNTDLNSVLEGILLCITLGMLLYIVIFELLREVFKSKSLATKVGLGIGFLLVVILCFL